jgi:membrane fusion protein, copper/silver efflux system
LSAPATSRGAKVMAAVRWALLLAVTALAAYSVWRYWGPGRAPHADHRENRYYCAMHPQIVSPDPGECPICHMRLELIPEERRHATPAASPTPPDADAGVVPDVPATPADASTTPAGLAPVMLSLERQQLIGVTTVAVVRRELGQRLRVPGVVEVPESRVAQVHVRAPGFIERVSVRESGVRVSRGQPLAWVYSPQVDQAQQELLTARRWVGHAPDGGLAPGPADVVAAARRNLLLLGVAEVDVDAIARRGEAMRAVPLRAPMDGYVTRYAAVLGQYATPEATLYELSDLSRVWVVASLFERDLARVRRGTPALFTEAGADAPALAATVELVEPSVGVETRTARVRLAIANPGLRLRPGQYGDVTFALPGVSALVVPRDAVVDTGEARYAFVALGDGRFEPRVVRAGALVGEDLEVLSGLREGERVVARGGFMLDAESRLQAALSASPAGADAGAGAP